MKVSDKTTGIGEKNMSQVTQHIGKRIRFYRKNLKMSLEELANAIHKSKSTVSKYEAGNVVVDIDTLFDIAKALRVPTEKLIDYKEPSLKEQTPFMERGFFNRPGNYYMYHLDSTTNRIIHSVIEIKYSDAEGEGITAVFYNNVADYENLFNCHYYYSGEIAVSDLYTNFAFHNQINLAEKVFIVVVNSLRNENFTSGLVAGISSTYLVPTAFKAIFSHMEMEDDEMIRHALQFTKEDISLIRKNNALLLANAFPVFGKK